MTTTDSHFHNQHPAIVATRRWLEDVVIGLNLCPFAHKPNRQGLIDLVVSEAEREEEVLLDLQSQMQRLDQTPPNQLETVVLVVSNCLQDFGDYNQFLDWVDSLIEQFDWQGIYQVASFHPDYQFGGTQPEDRENLTNRAPYPLLHIIREDSMEKALAFYPDSDKIPETNIARVSSLTESEIAKLFPYLNH